MLVMIRYHVVSYNNTIIMIVMLFKFHQNSFIERKILELSRCNMMKKKLYDIQKIYYLKYRSRDTDCKKILRI